MNIISLYFVLFLFIVFPLFWTFEPKHRNIVLLLSNYVFFILSCKDLSFIYLIYITLCSFFLALFFAKYRKKKTIIIGIVLCILPLASYKFFGLFAKDDNLLVPIGLSFYSLEAVGYLVDVYKNKIEVERNLIIYSCYISLFPTITSGPIEKVKKITSQLKEKKIFVYEDGVTALKIISWGLFKKTVVADNISTIIDPVYNSPKEYYGLALLICIFLYSIQIYADFSGYSDIAVGLGKLFGIELTNNFRLPYFSKSIKEFWSKWHISLSSWLRDYIYIPLGGNRCSKLRNNMNIIITFVVSGMWHGISATYIIWGLLHGTAQIIDNKVDCKETNKVVGVAKTILVFVFVSAAWVFFRSSNVSNALYMLNIFNISKDIFDINTCLSLLKISKFNVLKIIVIILVLIFVEICMQNEIILRKNKKLNIIIKWIIYIIFGLLLIYLSKKGVEDFVYYKY